MPLCVPHRSTSPPVRALPDTALPSAIPAATLPRRVRAHPRPPSRPSAIPATTPPRCVRFLPRSPFVSLTMALLRLTSHVSPLASRLSPLTSHHLLKPSFVVKRAGFVCVELFDDLVEPCVQRHFVGVQAREGVEVVG